jgi:hypothetical protein
MVRLIRNAWATLLLTRYQDKTIDSMRRMGGPHYDYYYSPHVTEMGWNRRRG